MESGAETIRILLTEDVGADAELEVRELRRAGLRVTHLVVQSEDEFVRALREFGPDIILSDFSMPGFDGMAALALSRELNADVPFIFVSGTIGEEYAIRALKNGATDYVLKTNLVRLPAAVERALVEARERSERRRIEAELGAARERLASIIDSLPDMLWSVALPGEEILYVGPAAREIFGRGAEDFLVDHELWINVVHPDDRGAMAAAWRRTVDEGQPYDVEYRVVQPDGRIRWISDRGTIVRDGQGRARRIDGVARDITEQVEHRQRIARLSRIRELVGDLNAAMVRTRDRLALFAEFCRIAVTRGGFALARIVELDAAGVARIAATTEGDATLFQQMLEGYNRDPAHARTLLADALRSGRPVVSNDIAVDGRVANRADLAAVGTYALALLPILLEGKVAGLVSLRAREAGFFDQEELRLLSEMVSNLSFALELSQKQDHIVHLALYDALTDLPNRTLFHERLAQTLEAAKLGSTRAALALIDLDRFKAINDTFGRDIGDRVLKAVAGSLRQTAGDVNRVARLGSNVFAYIFPSIESAEEVARRIESRAVFAEPLDFDGHEVRLSAKTGIAVFPDDGTDAETLLRNAEASLERAKETGERYLFYAPEINARVAEHVELEHRLRRAVEHGELFLHYQPKVDLASRSIIGMEALMRWMGPDNVLISPARFVPVLEQTGLILEAGRQALATASAAFRRWQALGLAVPRIAVNVSALQLRRRDFVADVRAALGDVGPDGGGVDIEITESLLMTEVDESIRKLRELRDMGMRIALDDFGTGYSSLAYLSKLPVDALKIDRAFIRGMTENADDTSIIATVISLAQTLRLKVVAEGVETEPQAQLLRLLRCDQAQGYLFSPPVAAERLHALLEAVPPR